MGLSGALVTTTRPTSSSPDTPYRLAADVRVRLEPLSHAELAPLGIPDLHASTGGEPRLLAEALTNGHAADYAL